eukprot:2044765-Rhodomonas_salina.1
MSLISYINTIGTPFSTFKFLSKREKEGGGNARREGKSKGARRNARLGAETRCCCARKEREDVNDDDEQEEQEEEDREQRLQAREQGATQARSGPGERTCADAVSPA